MGDTSKRSPIPLDRHLHAALRLKAAHANRSLSDLVNDAARQSLAEEEEALAAFEDRISGPTMRHEDLLDELKADGKI